MILNESAGFNFNSAFDAYFTANKSYKDYAAEVGDDLAQVIDDAKNGSGEDQENARYYLIINAKDMIYKVCWNNFLKVKPIKLPLSEKDKLDGKKDTLKDQVRTVALSNKELAARLNNGGFEDFCPFVFIALDKCLKAFNSDKYDKVKIGNWQWYFGRYLKAEAIMENYDIYINNPTENAIHPDSENDVGVGDAAASYWDDLQGNNVGLASNQEHDEFTDAWADLCNDSSLDSSKDDVRGIVADLLRGKEISEIAANRGCSKNKIRYSIAASFGDLCKKYDISQSDLAQNLHKNPDKLLRMLEK